MKIQSHQRPCPVCGRIAERGSLHLALCPICIDFEGGRLDPIPDLRPTFGGSSVLRLKDLRDLGQIDLLAEVRDLVVVLHICKRADLESGASFDEIRSVCRGVTELDLRRGLRLLVDGLRLVVREDDRYRLQGSRDDLVRALRQRLDLLHAN